MKDFDVSVLIPVYNAERYIEKAVNSALAQPETREVILVEDGSPDQSLSVCKELVANNPKVKLYRHPGGENQGAGASRNLAIEMSSHEYIAFLDADDYFLPNRFEKTKSVFRHFPNIDGVYECIGTEFLNAQAKAAYQLKNRSILTTVTRKDIPTHELFEELIIQKHGYFSLDGLTLKRSSVSKNFLFDPTLRIAQDTDFILRLAQKKSLLPGNLDNPVSLRGVHGQNRTLVNEKVLISKHQFSRLWFHRIRENNWSKKVNFHLLLRYSIATARLKTISKAQWPLAISNVIINIFSNPWIIKKIL